MQKAGVGDVENGVERILDKEAEKKRRARVKEGKKGMSSRNGIRLASSGKVEDDPPEGVTSAGGGQGGRGGSG